ncbi:MAG: aminotransferase class V-fold PLP-dependent enzyme [Alphaproteobacteria bacterium]|nr:aminotransferase class V-fold PLP-dependent enzyme [Alphaproteobacteria bacterium]
MRGAAIRGEWLLENSTTFLNHGSYGATPRPVLTAQERWRERLERQPVRFMEAELPGAIRAAAGRLAGFLGGRGDNLAFTGNATEAVNAVIRSLPLEPGDEILTTAHVYPWVRHGLRFVCDRAGARLVEAQIPVPVAGADAVLGAVERALGPRTRLVVVDHITSRSAIILPVRELVVCCRERGVPVLVDGAHAPGMLDLDVEAVGADWYAGNAHKWLCAPKGCGFLYAQPAAQSGIHPPVISRGLGSGYLAEFDWTGTRDYTAWLAVTAAIEFHEQMGAADARADMKALCDRAVDLLTGRWGTEASAPSGMRGAMAAVRLPVDGTATSETAHEIHDRLRRDHQIEAPVGLLDGTLWVRISAHVYNEEADYERLANAVAEMV